MLKRLGVVIPSTILTLLMAVGFSTPAFAYVDTTAVAEEPVQVVEEAEPTEEEKIPFTIAGNGEVEDNMMDDPSKEFFTVKTKGGNTFFLVIDRARNSENVYMNAMKVGVLRICRFSLLSGNCWYTIPRSRSSMFCANCSAARNSIMW